MMDYQKALLESLGSNTVKRQQKILWESEPFAPISQRTTPVQPYYRVVLRASWEDACGNGSNTFYCHMEVVTPYSYTPSTGYDMNSVPTGVVPQQVLDGYYRLRAWNGCHPSGPWGYFESTEWFAGDRDHWGLRKGEKRQLRHGGVTPAWKLTRVMEDGSEAPDFPDTVDSDTPPPPTGLRLEYRPWYIEGEGKERELDKARASAIWPDATDEDLTAPGLRDRLKQRLPALISEFKEMIDSLGFEW